MAIAPPMPGRFKKSQVFRWGIVIAHTVCSHNICMARGVDIWAAEIVLRLRDEGQDIKLICASPYKGFERGWSADWQQRYNAALRDADLVRYICSGYSRACFQIRNERMVNHSLLVIAVFNG